MTKKVKIKIIIIILGLSGFLNLLIRIFRQSIMSFDNRVYDIFTKYIINDDLTPLVIFITNFGGIIVLVSLTVFFLFFLKRKWLALSIIYNLTLITCLNIIIKSLIARHRPIGINLIIEDGYSFPSGHAMISTAYYGYLSYLIYKNIANKIIKWVLIGGLGVLISLISLSRVYLGVHYMSDILAGVSISIVYLVIYTSALKIYQGGQSEISK